MHEIKSFDDIIGNDNNKNLMRTSIISAKNRNVQLDHILITGYSGCGKTSFATAICNEMGVKYDRILCDRKTIHELNIKLIDPRLPDKSILILDEVHRLTDKESLYEFMDNNNVIFKYPGKPASISPATKLTLIAITSEYQMLDEPFINRFRTQLTIDMYSNEELKYISKLNVKSLNYDIEDEALDLIVSASWSIPRNCESYIIKIYDFMVANNIKDIITADVVREVFADMGRDKYGLNGIERSYIIELFGTFQCNPVGLSTISNHLRVDEKIITTKIEVTLMRQGLIERTSSGRILSDKGRELARDYIKNNI